MLTKHDIETSGSSDSDLPNFYSHCCRIWWWESINYWVTNNQGCRKLQRCCQSGMNRYLLKQAERPQ